MTHLAVLSEFIRLSIALNMGSGIVRGPRKVQCSDWQCAATSFCWFCCCLAVASMNVTVNANCAASLHTVVGGEPINVVHQHSILYLP